ncbi:MAG: hypothetical protein FWC91_09125 [Defluviitaleaceae bacterium]|nr:hypothetical protein [Defluviitaleaceae bacterium]
MSGKLEKATFIRYKRPGNSPSVDKRIEVQFNPSEYSIKRSANHAKKKPLFQDTCVDHVQTVSGGDTELTVSLHFDAFTPIKPAQFRGNNTVILPTIDMNKDEQPDVDGSVTSRVNEILSLIKYDHEEHEPPRVGFIWGKDVFFVGSISSQQTQYTLFSREGTPIRAKIDLTIVGEEAHVENKVRQYPMESPDRTKQRTLAYGDQLWMIAQNEYGDVCRWKIIASANGILNPRAINETKQLKVPSI